MLEDDPERIAVQAASTDPDTRTIEMLLLEVLSMVHSGPGGLKIGVPEAAFGWNFYHISVDGSVIRHLARLPGNSILKVRGDSAAQKFVNWLNRQAKDRGFEDKLHFALLSDLKSSRYGFF
jgi:hypothetical protein